MRSTNSSIGLKKLQHRKIVLQISASKTNGTETNKLIEQHLHKYGKGWYDMMVRIWRDRLQMMRVYRTGSLLGSVAGTGLQQQGYSMQAVFRFLEYCVYVDAGTRNGYTRCNPGDLQFLGKAYR